MKFATDQFATLFGSLRHLQASGLKGDKRRAPRLNYRGRVVMWLLDTDGHAEPVMAEVENFSARGIALIHCLSMAVGMEFLVMIPRKTGKPAPVLCRVTRTKEWGKSHHSIGAEFICVLPAKLAPTKPQDIERVRRAILDQFAGN